MEELRRQRGEGGVPEICKSRKPQPPVWKGPSEKAVRLEPRGWAHLVNTGNHLEPVWQVLAALTHPMVLPLEGLSRDRGTSLLLPSLGSNLPLLHPMGASSQSSLGNAAGQGQPISQPLNAHTLQVPEQRRGKAKKWILAQPPPALIVICR